MINKKLFIVLVFIVNSLHSNNSLDSLYIELERTMQSSSNYDNDKEDRVNILIAELAIDELSIENEIIITNKLIDAKINSDRLHIGKLNSGVYLIKIMIKGQVNFTKIIVN